MTALVTVLVSAAIVVLLVMIVWIPVQFVRRASRSPGPCREQQHAAQASDAAPPFGALPPLGPVGPLGNLSPDADINSPRMDEDDLYGE